MGASAAVATLRQQPAAWDELVVMPTSDGMITTYGLARSGRPCVVDLTTVTSLAEAACEVLCASLWHCSAVRVVGGSFAARAAVAAHLADCGTVLANELATGDMR